MQEVSEKSDVASCESSIEEGNSRKIVCVGVSTVIQRYSVRWLVCGTHSLRNDGTM